MSKRLLASVAVFTLLSWWGVTPASAQTPFDSDFDHFTTGWPLEGAHRNADCSTCHVGGIFQGTSQQCTDCHSKGGLVRATPVPPNHVRTTGQCQDCHLETIWSPVWRVDHFQVQGSCSTCHNNVIATGKNPGHIASGNNCEDCHSTFAWSPAQFDHDTIMSNCVSCPQLMKASVIPSGVQELQKLRPFSCWSTGYRGERPSVDTPYIFGD
jgi:hypothetical protein